MPRIDTDYAEFQRQVANIADTSIYIDIDCDSAVLETEADCDIQSEPCHYYLRNLKLSKTDLSSDESWIWFILESKILLTNLHRL